MKKLMTLLLLGVACGRLETVPQEIPPPAQCPAVERIRPTRMTPVELPPEPLQLGEHERVLRDTTTKIALALNTDTVFCSALGYSVSFLKVSVPDLDWLAHFDHRVEAAGLPCAAAGACSETVTPEGLLAGNPALSVVPVRVVLTEKLTLDTSARTCSRQLVEKVTIQLADRVLRHSAEGDIELWPYEKCAAVLKQ